MKYDEKLEPKLIETNINYDSIKAYFTFSFILDFNNRTFGEFVKKQAKKKWRIFSVKNGNRDDLDLGRVGVTPLISIFHKSNPKEKKGEYSEYGLWKDIYPKHERILNYYEYVGSDSSNSKYEKIHNIKVDFKATCRIFFNGSGCITFEVSQPPSSQNESDADWKKSKILLSLSKRVTGYSSVSKIAKSDSAVDKFLYDCFTDIIHKEFKEDLICTEITNFKSNPYHELENGLSPQNPNILIVLKTNESKGFLEKEMVNPDNPDSNLERKNQEVANLLLNIVPPMLDGDSNKAHIDNVRIPYGIKDEKGFLKNLSWDRRMFITTYRQLSILAYTKEEIINNFIERSMLDAVELIHTRWYFSIILNALLDEEIDKINGEPSDQNIEILRSLIKKRKLFAYFLHNPISYRYVGGSINDFVTEAEKDMRIEKLNEITYRKFKIVDQLYEDQIQYLKLNSYRGLYQDENYIEKVKEAYTKLSSQKS